MHDPSRFLLLFGSVTGKAESIAELIAEEASKRGLTPALRSMEGFGKTYDLTQEKVVVMVSSTTGDGDQPETAEPFWRKIKKKALSSEHFANVQFTILGLGDSNYTQFCNGPKTLHARLLDLGAKTFYEPDWADDGVGLELVVEPWIDNLWSALEKVLNVQTKAVAASAGIKLALPKAEVKSEDKMAATSIPDPLSVDEIVAKLGQVSLEVDSTVKKVLTGVPRTPWTIPSVPGTYLRIDFLDQDSQVDIPTAPAFPQANTQVCEVPIHEIRKLTSDPSVKRTFLVTLDLAGTDLLCEPGDSLGLVCPNPRNEVDILLKRLNLAEKAVLPYQLTIDPEGTKKSGKIPPFLPSFRTLRELFTWGLDLRSVPKKPLIRMLVEHARDQEDQDVLSYLCSREGGASYLSQVRGPHLCLLDLLLALPSCSPPLERLLEHLPRLQPRPYSAASALGEPSVQHVDFVFNTVDFERSQGRYFARRGLCTGWLEDLHALQPSERPKISIFGRSNQNFRYPLDETTSLIMIGPGTGVAPFRGFMQLRERQQPGLGSQAWLFTGCRHQEKDFLFREDWEKWTEQGVLSQFSPCFSRDEPEAQVRYVQHEIRAQAKAFIDFMERDSQSVILVCGDARNMAKDVQETIVECLVQEKGVSLDDAKSQMADWIIGRRYLQDIWT